MGFLPWSEVSCRSKDFQFRVSQSGFQALYGGVSSPFDVLGAARESASAKQKSIQEWGKQLGFEESDFLMACSPFMALFWAAWLAALCAMFLPLGSLRLRVSLALLGLMLLMLGVQLATDTPLERRMAKLLAEVVKEDPEHAMVLVAGFVGGKTPWFWIVAAVVVLAGVSEGIINHLWPCAGSPQLCNLAAGILAGGVALGLLGFMGQGLLWRSSLTGIEWRMARLREVEQAKEAQAKAEKDRQEAAARRQAEEREQERQRRLALEQEAERRHQREMELERQRAEDRRLSEQIAAGKARAEAEKVRLELERRRDEERREKERRQAEEEAAREKQRREWEEEQRKPVSLSFDEVYSQGTALKGRIVRFKAEGTCKVFSGGRGALFVYRNGTLLAKVDLDKVDVKMAGRVTMQVQATVSQTIRGVVYLRDGTVLSWE
jgi:hypothetical protein